MTPFRFYEGDIRAATVAVRKMITDSGYGAFVTDEQCRDMAIEVLKAVREQRNRK